MTSYHTQKRRRDDTPKVRKNLTLSREAVEAIQQFADEQGTSFSAAIESAALLGMGTDTATAIMPMLSSQVNRSIKTALRNFIKPMWFAASEAGTNRQLLEMMMLQILRQEYVKHEHLSEVKDKTDLYDAFIEVIGVEEGHISRYVRDELVDRATMSTRVNLRTPLDEVFTILREMDGAIDDA